MAIDWSTIAGTVVTEMTKTSTEVTVPTYYVDNDGTVIVPKDTVEKESKPTWKDNIIGSKINLTQYAKVATYAAIYFGVPLTSEQTVAILFVLEGLFTGVTFVLRTWFNK